jgi:hypothetical protein
MAVYRGNSGSIMYDGVIIGAVSEWRLLIVTYGDEARWTGSLVWQWLSLTSYDPTDDEYWLELEDGSTTPSYKLSGTTIFSSIDRAQSTLQFYGRGSLEGVPDPGPGQSEITIT